MRESTDASASWHDLITTANGLYRDGDLTRALAHYDRAVAAIDGFLQAAPIDVPLLMSKIVSHQNRAAVLAALGYEDAAEREFRIAHAFVLAVVDDERMPRSLREAARCHCRITHAELTAFVAERRGRRTPAGSDAAVGSVGVAAATGRAAHVLH